MEMNCQKACGICGASAYDPNTETCADKSEHCSTWAAKGDCENLQYVDYMEENCRKTCEWCLGRKDNNPTSSGSLIKSSVFISVIMMVVVNIMHLL
jgi:hypothetical protein